MNKKYLPWSITLGLIITIVGLLTGKFFFLLLILPLGFGIFSSKSNGDEGNKNDKKLNQ